MPFSLLSDPLFPIVSRKGRRRWISCPELADEGDDAPVDFDWPRPDFNIASFELLVGLLILALRLSDEAKWKSVWDRTGDPAALAAGLAPLVPHFYLDGDGPRFMQAYGGLEGEPTPIEALLIDTPGANGQKKNSDLLTHRARYEALCPAAAAMALYALQQFAPAGGAGNRTSMRGGGPLTTLVVPGAKAGERPTLWRTILANIVPREDFAWRADDLPRILPWLAPTLISDKAHGERAVNERDADVHPLQYFFGMPRRIALRFEGSGRCAMTGLSGALARGFVQKPWGPNYGAWFAHPLTPYRQQKQTEAPYSVKPKSSRLGYRDWVAVTLGERKDTIATPAEVLLQARGTRKDRLRTDGASDASVRVGGWVMNNMEAVTYLAAEQPLHLAPSDSKRAQRDLDAAALAYAKAAEIVAGLLVGAVRAALFSEGAKPSTDKAMFDGVRAAFFDATEERFHEALDDLLENPLPDEACRHAWLKRISAAAFKVFDTSAPVPVGDATRAGRIVAAAKLLSLALTGHTKQGRILFETLLLPPPSPPNPKKGRKNEG